MIWVPLLATMGVRPSRGCGQPIQFELGSANWYSMEVIDPALGDRLEREFVVDLPTRANQK